MSEILISITNNHWHDFDYLPETERENFEHLSDFELACDSFLKYRGNYYHISDFLTCSDDDWDGIFHETNMTATVIRLDDYGTSYQIGTMQLCC